ncbi:MAG TPA: ABC transporter substrate-binding protein [Clostridiales bacterium]|nr:ABC transporter substrate-binding protein [Clostridiales bacterium]
MKKLGLALILLVFLTAGCGTTLKGETKEINASSLKIGLMPAADSAPILLAEQRGYFKELGLDVDIEIYLNAVNRQSALQTGQLDGAMTDLIAAVNNIQNGFDMKITTSTDGSFPFLVRKGFEEKKDITVGVMEVSVSNFLSDEYLKSKYNMKKIYIDEIPARLEMIKEGKVDMASIPEPMASMGELNGLEKRVFENKDHFMPEAMVFTARALKEKEQAIKLFHQAFDRAVDDIKRDDTLARDILIDKLQLDPRIRDMMVLPVYHHTRVPDEAYINKIVQWIEKVQGTDITVEYEDMTEGKFASQ